MKKQTVGALVLSALFFCGCQSELYHNLSERECNAMIVALEQVGIDATKVRDERDPEAWMVTVPAGAHAEAVHALEARGLPRPEIQGFDSFYPGEGLVPTSSEEHVVLQYATSQELRKSLLAVDGVIDAHVNLVLPDPRASRLRTTTPVPARASVVVKYDSAHAAPVTGAQVKSIVSGGVRDLHKDAVSVLLTPARAVAEPLAEPRLVQVGPISVPASTKGPTQLIFVVLTAVILGLAAALAAVLLRRRR